MRGREGGAGGGLGGGGGVRGGGHADPLQGVGLLEE